jgi:hypothetical protein
LPLTQRWITGRYSHAVEFVELGVGVAVLVGVAVFVGVAVGVAVGVGLGPPAPQKPPARLYVPPLSVPASGWPAVPRRMYVPPLLVPPPPSTVCHDRS